MTEKAPVLDMPTTEARQEKASMIGELKSLALQSSHYVLGFGGSLLLGFISFPIMTRVFSVADFGTIDLIQRTLLLATALGKMGLQNSVFREYHPETFAADPLAENRYYSTMFLGTAVFSLIATLLFGVVAKMLPGSIIDAKLADYFAFCAILIFARSAQSILWGFLRIEERTKLYNILNLLLKAASIALIMVLLFTVSKSVKSYYTATITVELAAVVGLTIFRFRKGLLRFKYIDRNLLITALAFGLPMCLQELSCTILDSGDRFLVKLYLGDNALGLYSAAYGVSAYVRTFLETPMALAIMPIYLRLWRTQGKEKTSEFLSHVLNAYFFLAAVIFAVAAVSARDALILFASEKYSASASLIPTLVAGILIYAAGSILMAGLLIEKKTKILFWVMTAAAALNVFMNCVLLPRMGLQGAAVATLVSFTAWVITIAFFSWRVLPLHVNLRSVVSYFIAAVITWFIGSHIELHSAFWNFAVKPIVAFAIFGVLTYLADPQLRLAVRWLLQKCKSFLSKDSSDSMSGPLLSA